MTPGHPFLAFAFAISTTSTRGLEHGADIVRDSAAYDRYVPPPHALLLEIAPTLTSCKALPAITILTD
jgi:hypothetical protein